MKPIREVPFLTYYTIAADAHKKMEGYLKRDGQIQWPSLGKYHESAIGQATIVLVISIIALESLINNYAERKLGVSFVKRNMRNMGIVKKWTTVPELAKKKTLPKDDNGLNMLRKLVSMRNFIVHTKSGQITWEEFKQRVRKKRTQNNRWELDLVSVSRSVFDCIGLICHRLLLVDPEDPVVMLLSNFAITSKERPVM